MRLFAAIDPPESARQHLAEAVAGAGLPNRALRLADPKQWHITVAFYGDVGEQAATELTERLERAAGRTPAMTLAISSAGTFPADATQARVLWTGVSGETEALGRLADRARAAGRRCGLQMESGRYRPHLTIGRSRGGPADLNAAAAALSDYRGDHWRATSLQLVRSTLGAEVKHEVIATLPLA